MIKYYVLILLFVGFGCASKQARYQTVFDGCNTKYIDIKTGECSETSVYPTHWSRELKKFVPGTGENLEVKWYDQNYKLIREEKIPVFNYETY